MDRVGGASSREDIEMYQVSKYDCKLDVNIVIRLESFALGNGGSELEAQPCQLKID